MSFTNDAPVHDPHLYDPDRHDNQIVAVYEDDSAAERARAALIEAGVPEHTVQLMSAPEAKTAEPESNGDQIMNALLGLFTPAPDKNHYAHAVGRGHAMIVVTPTGSVDRHRLIEVLEQSHPIDFDAKLEEWRQAGYEAMADQAPASTDEGRVGQREPTKPASRVRSYIANRLGTPATDPAMQTGGTVPNATPGAESSGMNSPRSQTAPER